MPPMRHSRNALKGMPQRLSSIATTISEIAVGLAVLVQARLQLDATFADGGERHRIEGVRASRRPAWSPTDGMNPMIARPR